MKSTIVIICIILAQFGCKQKITEPQAEDYEVYVNQIIKSFAQDMKKEYGLICYGSGGRMPFDVEEIGIDFIYYHQVTIDEARKLEVIVTEKFLNIINSNEKIRPFLREYPFTPPRANVAISFFTSSNEPYRDGSVAFVFQVKNKIFYRADKENSPRYIPLMDEPYDEALKIVNESSK